ncbi:MAG TPA: aminotransferase class I/II-fold pyridoxal phosphate-dependent enzyme [Micropruina sp.]|nr:aminotransferase class I/II-fold pyridoxal phosphate-dependent enzyme [Micropruina sp.]
MTIFSLTESELRQRRSLKWRTYAPDVLPLWVAEMDAAVQPSVRRELDAALDRGDTGYPWGNDYADAYRASAASRWGLELDPAQVRRGGDVMNAVLCILEKVTDPGDGIVITAPVYPPFWQVTSGYRRRTVAVELTAEGRLDLPALEQAFAAPDVTAFLLCSPHNPTGTVHSAEELAAVATLCERNGVRLVVDEIHAWLVDPGTMFVPILSLPEASRALVAISAGKSWNLAAFKAGLYVGGADADDVLDHLPPLATQSTGHLGAIAHAAAVRNEQAWVDQVCAEVAANKQLLSDLLHALLPAAQYRAAPGTYLAWVDCTELGLGNPARHFEQVGRVAFSPGANFSQAHDQWVRVNLATSPQILTQAVERMAVSLRA